MISSVRGTGAGRHLDHAVIEVGGVGLAVRTTPATLAGLRRGEQARLSTTLVVREDSLTLFGFASDEAKELFELVQSVSGVGPEDRAGAARRARPGRAAPGAGRRGHRRADPGARASARRAPSGWCWSSRTRSARSPCTHRRPVGDRRRRGLPWRDKLVRRAGRAGLHRQTGRRRDRRGGRRHRRSGGRRRRRRGAAAPRAGPARAATGERGDDEDDRTTTEDRHGRRDPTEVPGDDELEASLRPRSLDEFVGQVRVREQLELVLSGAKLRGSPPDHVLLAGPPGLGKTSLAMIIAAELGAAMRLTSGPALERAGDLAAMLSNLVEGDVLFIDEIHRIARPAEEMLYLAMEDFRVDVMVGKGPGATSIPLEIAPFTLVGATTRSGQLTSPLRDRFGFTAHMEFYSPPN